MGPNQSDWGPHKKEEGLRAQAHMETWREDRVRTQGDAATHKPRTEASEGASRADTLILGFQPSEL